MLLLIAISQRFAMMLYDTSYHIERYLRTDRGQGISNLYSQFLIYESQYAQKSSQLS